MTRGTKRKSADVSASGAAAAPPPPASVAAAPQSPKKRGRPKKATGVEAVKDDGEALIAAALTVERQKRELLLVAERARVLSQSECGARDAAAALSVEARCRNKLIDLLGADKRGEEIEALRAELAAMNARLAARKGSAQRADVARAPRRAPGAEAGR